MTANKVVVLRSLNELLTVGRFPGKIEVSAKKFVEKLNNVETSDVEKDEMLYCLNELLCCVKSDIYGTEAAAWRASNKPDPQNDFYDYEERSLLTGGEFTDDDVADMLNVKKPNEPKFIIYAKNRIHWLSRKLFEAQNRLETLTRK